MADDDLQALRRRHAAGEDVAGPLVRALLRAGLHREVVAEHGRRTRDGGALGDDVEAAWRVALATLTRGPTLPGAPHRVYSTVWAGPDLLGLIGLEWQFGLADLSKGTIDPPRAIRGWAPLEVGLVVLESSGRETTLVRGADRSTTPLPAVVGTEWLGGASRDGELLLLREAQRARLVHRSTGAAVSEFREVDNVRLDWQSDRVLVWSEDGTLSHHRLSRPHDVLGRLPWRGEFEVLADGRVLEIADGFRVVDLQTSESIVVAGPPDLLLAELAPDRAALHAIDFRGGLHRLPLVAPGPHASRHIADTSDPTYYDRPAVSCVWHPFAAAAVVTIGDASEVRAVDGTLLASLDSGLDGLDWTPDGLGLLLRHQHETFDARSGTLELWRVPGV